MKYLVTNPIESDSYLYSSAYIKTENNTSWAKNTYNKCSIYIYCVITDGSQFILYMNEMDETEIGTLLRIKKHTLFEKPVLQKCCISVAKRFLNNNTAEYVCSDMAVYSIDRTRVIIPVFINFPSNKTTKLPSIPGTYDYTAIEIKDYIKCGLIDDSISFASKQLIIMIASGKLLIPEFKVEGKQ